MQEISGKTRSKAPASEDRPRAGRPTREQAERRHEELLDRALELFLEHGFEMATLEMIVASVGMTKRTVRTRYPDKRTLFRATVQRAIERWIVPLEALHAVDGDDLEATLTGVARIRMANAISPAGLRLQRIINAESYRFPEIAKWAYEQGALPTVEFLAQVFRRHAKRGTVRAEQPEIMATAFLSMVVGAPSRAVVWGNAVDEQALDERIRFCVRLFLRGVCVA